MTPGLSRAARGLIGWSQEDLADHSKVSVTTIRNFERGATQPIAANLAALQRAFEDAGIEFIPENGGGVGLRLKKRSN
jgi:transcriptional regulator with XRE-family HTH domain